MASLLDEYGPKRTIMACLAVCYTHWKSEYMRVPPFLLVSPTTSRLLSSFQYVLLDVAQL